MTNSIQNVNYIRTNHFSLDEILSTGWVGDFRTDDSKFVNVDTIAVTDYEGTRVIIAQVDFVNTRELEDGKTRICIIKANEVTPSNKLGFVHQAARTYKTTVELFQMLFG